MSPDSLIPYSYNNRTELKIANENIKLKKMNYSLINSLTNPVISFFGNAGYKNGFLPDLNKLTANYVVGIGLSYPLFDAFRTKHSLEAVNASINIALNDEEITKKQIAGEVIEKRENLNTAQRKMDHLELQLEQAEEAFRLAEISFESGVITNIELLDASTNVAESKLLLLKAKIDYDINSYKLKAALGIKLY